MKKLEEGNERRVEGGEGEGGEGEEREVWEREINGDEGGEGTKVGIT